MKKNVINELFNITHPINSGGMVWCSGWRLASAVSNCGGLGLIGSGSMHPETLREHIQKTKLAVEGKSFGVNVPLLYPQIDEVIKIIIEEQVPIVFTSAGSPKKYTGLLKEHGIKVAHVVSSSLFAKKSEEAGVDAVVAEGFEAGGHNGREETTTLALIPAVRKAISIPLIAAGGIASGQAMLACMALGADGVQIGSLFASSLESSANEIFKQEIISASEGDTLLSLKKLNPVRLLKNKFFEQIAKLESEGASKEELASVLGKGRAKQGMFLGNLDEGELEIGQISAHINQIDSVETIFQRLLMEYEDAKSRIR